ncbi:3-hydroxyacyl-CoA dehydrogenase-like protein, partial [Aureobasidium melanogenum]
MSDFQLPDPTKRPVAILGGGVLGRRIACMWAAAGYDVHIRDPSPKSRSEALQYIDENIGKKTYTDLSAGTRTPGQYEAFADIELAVRGAWFVLEAVPEVLSIKIDVFGEVSRLAPPDCIMASNSSSYKSGSMLSKVDDASKHRILNAHYMMPPQILAIEFMTDGYTDPKIFPFMVKLHEDIGLVPAVARKESTGFIMNRLWAAMKREIMTILAEDVSDPAEIDSLFQQMFGSKITPCTLMDQVGLDTVAFIEDNYVNERGLDTSLTTDFLRKNYIEKGKLGAKSDKGGLYPPSVRHPQQTTPLDASGQSTLYFLDVGIGANIADPEEAAHSGRVLSMDVDGTNVRELLTGLQMPDGIVVSQSANRMFFTCMGTSLSSNTGSIMSATLGGTGLKTIIPKGHVHTPKQLTIDEQNQMIYFCDREGLRIHRCNYDGGDHEIILQTGDWKLAEHKRDQTRWCVGIAVDPKRGHIYWTQKGASKSGTGRIFRTTMELPRDETVSTRSTELLFDNLPEPIDLFLIQQTQTLYWTDRGEHPFGNTLNKAFVGTHQRDRRIVARHFNEAIGVTVEPSSQQIYVTDLGGRIYRIDGETMECSVIHASSAAYTGIDLL